MKKKDAITKIMQDFERTLANCEYYAKLPAKDVAVRFSNEIGVARGLAYALEALGVCPHTEQFLKFVRIQQLLKYVEKMEKEAEKIGGMKK